MDELREQLQKDVNEIMDNELTTNGTIKEKIYNEIVNSSDLVPEEVARTAVDKVFSKLHDDDSYLAIDNVIKETMDEIISEYGEDENNEKHYHKLYSDLQDKFEENRKELIENGIVTDIVNFNDDFEVTFDELNNRINETQKYLNEFFYIRDQKIAVIKDESLTLDEKKERIAQINENSILSDIENPDVKREYQLFNQSSDEMLMGIFADENLTPDQVASEIEKYEVNWKDVVEKIYGTDIENMDILSKQIDVVMENTKEELAAEYKSIYKELGIQKGSEEEKIFDAAFENNCNEQEYIDKMTEIKMAEDESIIQMENELGQIEAELIDLDTRLGEMSEKEIAERRKELKAQKADLVSRKEDTLSNLKSSLADELHARFEKMANYQRKALRFVGLEEKFNKNKQYVSNVDLNRNIKQHNSLNDAMNFKNKKGLRSIQEKISLNEEINMEELAKINKENLENKKQQEEQQANVKENDNKNKKEEPKQEDNVVKDNSEDNEDKNDTKDTKTKSKNNNQHTVVQQVVAAPSTQQQSETALREISEAENARNIIDEFLKTSGVHRKKFFVEDGYVKLADAVAAIKDNDEGFKLSRKERKEISDALDTQLKNSLNESELREKDGDIVGLFNKIKTDIDLTEEDRSQLFEDLFKYNENKLPFIATSSITKENRDKLGQLLKGYRQMLQDGELTAAEIEDFDKYIINPLNANCIRNDIEDMGFWKKAGNRFKSIFAPNKGNVRVDIGRALNSELKYINEIKSDIKSCRMLSGPVGLADATYSLDEIVNNDVNRTNNEKTKTPRVINGQEK